MIETFQDEKELEKESKEPADQNFATVAGVHSDGLSLKFDGETDATTKHYKCNTFFKYAVGDRVHILKDSGTYVVICVIGSPASSIAADTATTATTATTAETATTATNATNATNAANATNAQTAGQVGNSTNHVDMSGTTLQPNSNNSIALGSSTYWYSALYAKNVYVGSGTTEYIHMNQTELYPRTISSSYKLGTSTYPWTEAYIGKTKALIGTATNSQLGFFGTTPISRITLSTTSANQGYSSATSSNYLNILNNIAGILKKLGLIST